MTESEIRSSSDDWKEGARGRLGHVWRSQAAETKPGYEFVDRLLFGVSVRGGGQRFFHPAVAGAAVEPSGVEFVGDRRGIIEKLDAGYIARVTFGGSKGARSRYAKECSSFVEAERYCVSALLELLSSEEFAEGTFKAESQR